MLKITLIILSVLVAIYLMVLLFMNISLLILKRDFWMPLYVYYDDDTNDFFELYVNDKKFYYNPLDIRNIGYLIFKRKEFIDTFPFREAAAWISVYGEYVKSYEALLTSLIERQKFGDAMTVAAFIVYKTGSVPPITNVACEYFIDNNHAVHLSKYPTNVANDIYTVFVSMYNINYSQSDSPYQRRYLNYIDDKECLQVDSDFDPYKEEGEHSDHFSADIYKYYNKSMNINDIKAKDEIHCNGIYNLHVSDIEMEYAKQLNKTDLDAIEIIHKLLNKGMVTGATMMACEIADNNYYIRRYHEDDKEWCREYIGDDDEFIGELYFIVKRAFENFTFVDEFVEMVVDYYGRKGGFTGEEMESLIEKQEQLKGIKKEKKDKKKKK